MFEKEAEEYANRGGKMKQFCRKIRNLYIIIRYCGFSYLDAIYYNYKQNKDVYEDFWECLQEELYAMADSQ